MKTKLLVLLLTVTTTAAWGQTDIVGRAVYDAGFIWDGTNKLPVESMVEFHSKDFFDKAKHFGTYTNIIIELARSGELCRVLGHQWKRIDPWWQGITMEGNTYVYREHCGLCDKYRESRETIIMPSFPVFTNTSWATNCFYL